MRTLFCILAIAWHFSVFACINHYYYDKSGNPHESGMEKIFFLDRVESFNFAYIKDKIVDLESKLKSEYDYKAHSDYAVGLLEFGRTTEALAILQRLSVAHPNDYQIAGNLGTAYELAGKNDSALKYIRKEIALHPDAHHGSEWVHEQILLTKMAIEKDSKYLEKHTVIDWVKQKDSGKARNAVYHIQTQLLERMPFTPQPDALVGHLLLELGDVLADESSITDAYSAYGYARGYLGKTPQIEDKLKQTLKIIKGIKNKKQAASKIVVPTAVPSFQVSKSSLMEHEKIKDKLDVIDFFNYSYPPKTDKDTLQTASVEKKPKEAIIPKPKANTEHVLAAKLGGLGLILLLLIAIIGYFWDRK